MCFIFISVYRLYFKKTVNRQAQPRSTGTEGVKHENKGLDEFAIATYYNYLALKLSDELIRHTGDLDGLPHCRQLTDSVCQ